MKFNLRILVFIFSFGLFLGFISADDPQYCGNDAGEYLCRDNCNKRRFCGSTAVINCEIEQGCKIQWWSSSPPANPQPSNPLLPPPSSDKERPDHRCGKYLGNTPCEPGRCCSYAGWCGDGYEYCSGSNCQYQCWSPLPRPLLLPNKGNDTSGLFKFYNRNA